MRKFPRIHLCYKDRQISITPHDNIFAFIGCSFIVMIGFMILLPSILCGKVGKFEK